MKRSTSDDPPAKLGHLGNETDGLQRQSDDFDNHRLGVEARRKSRKLWNLEEQLPPEVFSNIQQSQRLPEAEDTFPLEQHKEVRSITMNESASPDSVRKAAVPEVIEPEKKKPITTDVEFTFSSPEKQEPNLVVGDDIEIVLSNPGKEKPTLNVGEDVEIAFLNIADETPNNKTVEIAYSNPKEEQPNQIVGEDVEIAFSIPLPSLGKSNQRKELLYKKKLWQTGTEDEEGTRIDFVDEIKSEKTEVTLKLDNEHGAGNAAGEEIEMVFSLPVPGVTEVGVADVKEVEYQRRLHRRKASPEAVVERVGPTWNATASIEGMSSWPDFMSGQVDANGSHYTHGNKYTTNQTSSIVEFPDPNPDEIEETTFDFSLGDVTNHYVPGANVEMHMARDNVEDVTREVSVSESVTEEVMDFAFSIPIQEMTEAVGSQWVMTSEVTSILTPESDQSHSSKISQSGQSEHLNTLETEQSNDLNTSEFGQSEHLNTLETEQSDDLKTSESGHSEHFYNLKFDDTLSSKTSESGQSEHSNTLESEQSHDLKTSEFGQSEHLYNLKFDQLLSSKTSESGQSEQLKTFESDQSLNSKTLESNQSEDSNILISDQSHLLKTLESDQSVHLKTSESCQSNSIFEPNDALHKKVHRSQSFVEMQIPTVREPSRDTSRHLETSGGISRHLQTSVKPPPAPRTTPNGPSFFSPAKNLKNSSRKDVFDSGTTKFKRMRRQSSNGGSTAEPLQIAFADSHNTSEVPQEVDDPILKDMVMTWQYPLADQGHPDVSPSPIEPPRRTFNNSAFYETGDNQFPSVSQQKDMCKMIANSLTSEANQNARGHVMFMKKNKRANKYSQESQGRNVDAFIDSQARAMAMEAEATEQKDESERVKTFLADQGLLGGLKLASKGGQRSTEDDDEEGPAPLFGGANSNSKGAKMFFTRQASSGSWVVDEHNVRHVARRQPSFDANLLWMMETSVNDPRPPDKEALSRMRRNSEPPSLAPLVSQASLDLAPVPSVAKMALSPAAAPRDHALSPTRRSIKKVKGRKIPLVLPSFSTPVPMTPVPMTSVDGDENKIYDEGGKNEEVEFPKSTKARKSITYLHSNPRSRKNVFITEL